MCIHEYFSAYRRFVLFPLYEYPVSEISLLMTFFVLCTLEGDFLLCVGRPKTVEVGKNTSFAVKMVEKNPNR